MAVIKGGTSWWTESKSTNTRVLETRNILSRTIYRCSNIWRYPFLLGFLTRIFGWEVCKKWVRSGREAGENSHFARHLGQWRQAPCLELNSSIRSWLIVFFIILVIVVVNPPAARAIHVMVKSMSLCCPRPQLSHAFTFSKRTLFYVCKIGAFPYLICVCVSQMQIEDFFFIQ